MAEVTVLQDTTILDWTDNGPVAQVSRTAELPRPFGVAMCVVEITPVQGAVTITLQLKDGQANAVDPNGGLSYTSITTPQRVVVTNLVGQNLTWDVTAITGKANIRAFFHKDVQVPGSTVSSASSHVAGSQPVQLSDGTVTITSFDNTGTHSDLPVSLYGKGTAAGDTAIPAGDSAAHGINIVDTDGTNTVGTTTHPKVTSNMPSAGWSLNHQPAVATQATASKASAGAGVKNVLTDIHAKVYGDGTGGAAGAFVINVRDGLTGAGTVLRSWTIVGTPGANTSAGEINIGGLWIEGSAATALTVEISAAPATHIFAEVGASGVTTPI